MIIEYKFHNEATTDLVSLFNVEKRIDEFLRKHLGHMGIYSCIGSNGCREWLVRSADTKIKKLIEDILNQYQFKFAAIEYTEDKKVALQ